MKNKIHNGLPQDTEYKLMFNAFKDKKGIVEPIYATAISVQDWKYNPKFNKLTSNKNLTESEFIDKVCNIRHNQIIGYFAAVKDEAGEYKISMSFCSPIDFMVFTRRTGKYIAMLKALENLNTLKHINNHKRIIGKASTSMYYFDLNDTIKTQYWKFNDRCKTYYTPAAKPEVETV